MLRNLIENGLLGELKSARMNGPRSLFVSKPTPSRSVAIALIGVALDCLLAVLSSNGGKQESQEDDVPFYDQGGRNYWHPRQWD
jgi:hypothetical protein